MKEVDSCPKIPTHRQPETSCIHRPVHNAQIEGTAPIVSSSSLALRLITKD